MAKTKNQLVVIGAVEPLIRELRGERVLLDADLARVYGVPTFRRNEAVKRNRERFPEDFLFPLTPDEFANLISQPAISGSGHGERRKLPWAFTEHGANPECEAAYWFELHVDGEIVPAAKLQPLRQECDELTAIFVTIIKHAKA